MFIHEHVYIYIYIYIRVYIYIYIDIDIDIDIHHSALLRAAREARRAKRCEAQLRAPDLRSLPCCYNILYYTILHYTTLHYNIISFRSAACSDVGLHMSVHRGVGTRSPES